MVRSCVKNTPNYSITHNGTPATKSKLPAPSTNAFPRAELPESSQAEQQACEPSPDLPVVKQASAEERKAGGPDNKMRSSGRRSYEEICAAYENMLTFDWELKDINNLRHPPGKCPSRLTLVQTAR